MFRPIDHNALDREFRPSKPLSGEIRLRRIVDLYLSLEGRKEISPTVRVTYGEVWRIIRYISTKFPSFQCDLRYATQSAFIGRLGSRVQFTGHA